MPENFTQRTRIAAPAPSVFDWHLRPGALERLTPPWTTVRVLERQGGIQDEGRVVLELPVGPMRVRWVAAHRNYVAGQAFQDVQLSGPFTLWEHTHRVEPDGAQAAYLEDHIAYTPPLGGIGRVVAGSAIRHMLQRMFAYRHRTTAEDLMTHQAYPGAPMHVLVSGASGLVGSALIPFLTTGGHRVTRLVRREATADTLSSAVPWNPANGELDPERLDGIDAVVHLAGESVAGARWSEGVKARIRASRVQGTQTLCAALARMRQPPRVLVCASAIGYYGDRGDEVLTEESAAGDGFLADVCQQWEAATAPARACGIRVVHLRLGVVLSRRGGALAQMFPVFFSGLGGRVGHGNQYMSWISLDDLVGIILHALRSEQLSGPVNAVAPMPVTNAEFTTILGQVLRRPTVLPVPAAALRFALGDMADEMLLASSRVAPEQLNASGYQFRHPHLDTALRHTCGYPLRAL